MLLLVACGVVLVVLAAVAVAIAVSVRRPSAAGSAVGAPDPVQVQLDRSELLRRVGDALDLAVDDAHVYAATGRSLAEMQRGRRTELLDLEPGTAVLRPVARSAGPDGGLAACPVRSGSDCPSMRRAQVLVAHRSDDVAACSYLRERSDGPCSAVCVPIGIDGHTVGVIHVVGPVGAPPVAEELAELAWLAGRTGSALQRSRASALTTGSPLARDAAPVNTVSGNTVSENSVSENTVSENTGPVDRVPVDGVPADHGIGSLPPEAERVAGGLAVDPVSGLPGAADLRSRVASLVAQQVAFVLVLADVDGLSRINRDLGHEAGDAAVRALATSLARRGGPDAFAADRGDGVIALVCRDLSLRASVELVEGVRCDLLDGALAGATTAFTCSFGITNSAAAEDATSLMSLAESGVRRAKELGGDEIVYADAALTDGPTRPTP